MISEQNAEINIARLAAQRWLYSSAKRAFLLQFILDVPFMIGVGFFVAAVRSKTFMILVGLEPYDAGWIMATAGISVALIDGLILEQLVQSRKTTAARIQEAFDCDVLDMPWNRVLVGRQPEREEVLQASERNLRSAKAGVALRNWYPPCVEQLPQEGARFVCQRESLSWDADLRTKFISRLGILSGTVFFILFILGMAGNFSTRNFVMSVLLPSVPIFSLMLRQVIANRRTIVESRELRTRVDDLVADFLNNEIDKETGRLLGRSVQDAIYAHRKNAPLVPDRFYGLQKRRSEALAVRTAEEIVKEYNAKNEKRKRISSQPATDQSRGGHT